MDYMLTFALTTNKGTFRDQGGGSRSFQTPFILSTFFFRSVFAINRLEAHTRSPQVLKKVKLAMQPTHLSCSMDA